MIKVLMALLVGIFVLTSSSFAQPTPAATPATPAAAPAVEAQKPVAEKSAGKHEHHEHHPELRKAIRKLRTAKQDLEKASSEYGGHKAKAIEAIEQALVELKEALESDKK